MAKDLTDHLLDEGIKVNYMHSGYCYTRVEIIEIYARKLLCLELTFCEGLDIPEVSLVAILDAVKRVS